ncbi:cytochrome c oxidase subunit I [Mongoliimonas terrestris]|uniref:cytochrome c oxidase subunit I n=1 Tax=Mongoliimonas terrestris TaxID=1709001 RepID=UPI0009496795|nr:cytochrome c oxidase subunit I [Mongoliimonas terrestris]
MSAPSDTHPARTAGDPAPPTSPVALHKALDAIWRTPPGWGRLSAVNHTVVGRRFMLTAFAFFTIGGLLAMLIRAQLATPHSAFVGPALYNQIFTMHGTVMMFLFAIPMLEGWAMYLLPKMLGSRDMAFPRLSAYGYWCYLFGGSILIVALAVGAAPDAGWFMYTPLSSRPYSPGINADVWLIGVTFVEISAISAAVEIIVTILKLRAPGMSLDRMPIFAWYMLITALMMLFGFPPLILGSILLELERAFDWPFFDPTRGGDPLLWQHLFWLFGHPEVYIIFVPAAGLVSTMIPVLARHPLIGYTAIVASLVALAFLSFGLWVHHMFTVGIPHMALAFFSAASMLVAIPTGIQIFAWIGTLAMGRPRLHLPMLYLLGFFFVFVTGGLTGVMVAVVPFDWQAHDTHFVVAHLHYVLIGGFVFPMLAAAYYYLPLVTGRQTVYGLGKAAFWLIFLGMNATFFLMHLTGLKGMPRRVHTYLDAVGWTELNLVSSIGGFVMTMGFALFVVDVALQRRYGARTRRDPWQAETLEWAIPLPPTSYAFLSIPHVDGRAPLTDAPQLGAKLAAGEGYLAHARNGWQETIAVEALSGRPEQIVVLPRPTLLPLVSALATGVFFVSVLFKVYLLALAGLAITVCLLLAWTRAGGARSDIGPLSAGRGLLLPTHLEAARPPSWWGMVFLLLADGTMLASLLFGLFFLAVIASGWPPPAGLDGGVAAGAALAAGAFLAALAGRGALARARRGASPSLLLAGAAAGGVVALGGVAGLVPALPDPTTHAFGAVSTALLAYVGVHAAIGLLLAVYGLVRVRRGFVSARRTSDLSIGSLWHDYVAGAAAIALATLFGLEGMLAG